MTENENKLLQIFENILDEQKQQTQSMENIRFLLTIFFMCNIIVPLIFYTIIFVLYKFSPNTLLEIIKIIF